MRIYLTRHAKSYANARNPVFGNEKSPLDEKGIHQAHKLTERFRDEHGIDPVTYGRPVVASEFLRPQQTAEVAGFTVIHINPILNESEFDRNLLSGREIIKKHLEERWIPEETSERAQLFISKVRTGELPYEIYFAHGLFIASVLSELCKEAVQSSCAEPHIFDDTERGRGYIPELATITSAEI